MKIIIYSIFCFFISINSSLAASQFEELDKPPEGAHKGQMFLGGFVSLGLPFGDLITGEEKFVDGNTYEFTGSEITKELLVTHLSYDFGISFEYMPIDYIGAKSKLKRTLIVQRTLFGSDFQNWSETIYDNLSLLVGPSFHLTNRKQWDVIFNPVIGFAYAEYTATPIAAELVTGYNGDRKRDVSGITYGAELNLTVYFSGGLYISLGTDWNIYPISFDPPLSLSQGGKVFMDGKNSGNLQTINIALSAGYAFDN